LYDDQMTMIANVYYPTRTVSRTRDTASRCETMFPTVRSTKFSWQIGYLYAMCQFLVRRQIARRNLCRDKNW